MQLDKQNRLIIPQALRRLSTIEGIKDIAIMLKDRKTVYIAPADQVGDGKVISIMKIDEKGRMTLPKDFRKNHRDYLIYLEKGVLYITKN